MNHRFFISILLLCIFNQLIIAETLKSDSLFAKGVELYKQKNYLEAISFFESCNIIDSNCNNSETLTGYNQMWIASCYYKLNDITKAKEIDIYNYSINPIDRRLTAESDKFSQEAKKYFQEQNFIMAAFYAEKCAEIEKQILGEKSIWHANTLSIIGECNFYLNNIQKSKKLFEKANSIYICKTNIIGE